MKLSFFGTIILLAAGCVNSPGQFVDPHWSHGSNSVLTVEGRGVVEWYDADNDIFHFKSKLASDTGILGTQNTNALNGVQQSVLDNAVTNGQPTVSVGSVSADSITSVFYGDGSHLTGIASGGGGTNTFNFTATNSPNYFWNGTQSFWTTNASFTSLNVPTNAGVSTLTISNSSAGAITNSFPFTAWSLSAGAGVTSAAIPAHGILTLQFTYDGSRYYVADSSPDNATLSSLAALGATAATNYLFLNADGTVVLSNAPAGGGAGGGVTNFSDLSFGGVVTNGILTNAPSAFLYVTNNNLVYELPLVFFTNIVTADESFVTSVTSFGDARNDLDSSLGFKMTIGSSDIVVTSLGRWIFAGNSQTHTLTILDSLGTTTLATATLDASAKTSGAFAYTAITPVTLTAGATYYVYSSETIGGDNWDDVSTLSTTSDATVIQPAYDLQDASPSGSYGFVPVSFLYHL